MSFMVKKLLALHEPDRDLLRLIHMVANFVLSHHDSEPFHAGDCMSDFGPIILVKGDFPVVTFGNRDEIEVGRNL